MWVWVNTYRYIFSGMNIHKSQLFWGSRHGTRVLTHPHVSCFPRKFSTWGPQAPVAPWLPGHPAAPGLLPTSPNPRPERLKSDRWGRKKKGGNITMVVRVCDFSVMLLLYVIVVIIIIVVIMIVVVVYWDYRLYYKYIYTISIILRHEMMGPESRMGKKSWEFHGSSDDSPEMMLGEDSSACRATSSNGTRQKVGGRCVIAGHEPEIAQMPWLRITKLRSWTDLILGRSKCQVAMIL